MKRLFYLLILFLPLISYSQAHLGSTEKGIRDIYPNNTFEIGYNDSGEKYISTFIKYGTFVYYFDNESGLTNYCIQIVNELPYLNGQVEAYNKKYVIISDTEWKAYVEGGGVLNIKLTYNEEYRFHVFNYSE